MSKTPKIINDPNACAAELLDGLVEAYDGAAKKVGSLTQGRKRREKHVSAQNRRHQARRDAR